jgi:glc operon protein GlcG
MKTKYGLPLAAWLVLTASVAVAQAPAPAPLGLDEALKMGGEALKAAKVRGRPVAIVIVNREGRVISSMRMDGASFLSLEVAEAKAVTAAAIGAPTEALESAIDAGKTSLLSVRGLSPITGGLPVIRAGHIVAGVGVSGGTQEDDRTIAQAAAGS